MRRTLRAYYGAMSRRFGPSRWWPGDSPFEVAVGAILTQNTAWSNVEKAILNLKRERMLDSHAIVNARDELLHDALRPSGYFRVKAKRLRSFCAHLNERYDGRIEQMAGVPLELLRPELLGVHGIGPETADDILLYACDKPVFVVDAYTRRIFARHGLVGHDVRYEALREYFERNLPSDVDLFKDFHAQIVFTGKDFCKPNPRCDECPLKKFLSDAGPLMKDLPR